MSSMVKDFIEFGDRTSLDALIEQLVAVRDSLPAGAEAEMRLQGCDVSGRKLAIAYVRPAANDPARADFLSAYRASREREAQRLQKEVGVVRTAPRGSERCCC